MGGAHSPHMHTKQQEMDSIVHKVYRSIQTNAHLNKTLLVLLGDHGMNDVGEHGGNSVEELSTALLFISPHLQALPPIPDRDATKKKADSIYQYFSPVHQLDIVPTISGLLGLPVPRDNLGSFIPNLLPLWTTIEEQRLLILQNMIQLQHAALIQDHHVECGNNTLTDDCLQQYMGVSAHGHNLNHELSVLSKVIIISESWNVQSTKL